MQEIIRLLLVDDHTLFREDVKALLSHHRRYRCGWRSRRWRERGAAISGVLSPCGFDGQGQGLFPTPRGSAGSRPNPFYHNEGPGARRDRWCGSTMLQEDNASSLFCRDRAGARGYVLKGANPTEMLGVIRAVADGQGHRPRSLVRRSPCAWRVSFKKSGGGR